MARRKQVESACLVMNDVHYGKQTESFDTKVCKARLLAVSKKIGRISELLRGDYEIDELVIAVGGDVNDGTGIYPTQAYHQDEPDVQKQAQQLAEILEKIAREQLNYFQRVRFECVPGNHGRAGKFAAEAANWDLVMYQFLKLRLVGSGIDVNVNEEGDPFIRKFQIRGHDYLLYHGHAVRSYGNIPWYGLMVRVLRWLASSLSPFDVALFGHFHTCGIWTINNATVMLSGTAVSNDTWALQTFGLDSTPLWWLFGVSEHFPVTWMYRLEVGK